jgi:AraC family transcriptional activator of pobA
MPRSRLKARAGALPALLPHSLPTYALYGELGRTQAVDWLHCESIADRSQQHGWEIQPHRHETLFQILHIESGAATAWLETGPVALVGPCVLTLPALVPHGFRFEPAIRGTVLTVLEQHLMQRLLGQSQLASRLMQPLALHGAAGDAASLAMGDAVATLRAEFHGAAPWREWALDSALLRLAVLLGRLAPPLPGPAGDGQAPASPARALGHVQRFRALVEARFRQQPTLAMLATSLGITPTQLNRVCHQVLGHSALGVLHDRLVLEAQRDLAYTRLAVKQIALALGFADAGYFSRFFLRHTGHTPTAWRALAAR